MSEPRLLVISQVISVAFLRWLEAFAAEHGPVELWTGVDFAAPAEHLRVKRLNAYTKESYRSRLLAWIRFALTVTILLLSRPRRIPVLAITNPPLMPLILVLHRALFGRRYGIIEYDIYPQIMETMGLLTRRSLIYRIWWRWHVWALRRAALVITISPLMADELRQMTGGALESLSVIPTWTDTTRIQPLPRSQNPFAQEHVAGAEIVALYSGNLGATHAIETIIAAAEHVQQESRIQFLIIGDGVKYDRVEAAIQSGRAPNIRLLPLQPAAVVPYSLASADIAFVTLAPGYERLSLPSKTYDLMAAGCAIVGISQPGSGLDRLLQEHRCGRNFGPDQPEAIARWITELAADRAQLQALQQAARKAAEVYYSAERGEIAMSETVLKRLYDVDAAAQSDGGRTRTIHEEIPSA
jgi:glycosyltransferase involved in cell wall biosynthesis